MTSSNTSRADADISPISSPEPRSRSVNNIAEGAGKLSSGDERRYYLAATGSTTECAAMLDVCLRRRLITDDTHRRGKQLAERVVAMLTKLAKSHDT